MQGKKKEKRGAKKGGREGYSGDGFLNKSRFLGFVDRVHSVENILTTKSGEHAAMRRGTTVRAEESPPGQPSTYLPTCSPAALCR